jgi:hypothetical protein
VERAVSERQAMLMVAELTAETDTTCVLLQQLQLVQTLKRQQQQVE